MGLHIADTEKKRVVIVGGGFGGLKLANKLKDSNYQVVLIDKNNYHQFPPLLYQVASSGLESSSISFPFRKVFQKRKDFFFRLAEVTGIDRKQNLIQTSIGELQYDYLVLAAGTVTNFFGNEVIRQQALPMKTIEEALALRNTLLLNFEKATICTDPAEKQALMNIVIVGGGATGVEISGVLAEMKRFILPKDYPDLDKASMNIYLLEGTHRLLAAMSEEASRHAEQFLHEMGVTVILNKKVTDYKEGKVIMDDGTSIDTRTFIWVSGVTATHFDAIAKDELGHAGRILVNEFGQLPGTSNVFAIGDVCLQTEEHYPHGHPQVAQVAIQQGNLLAENLKRINSGVPLLPFRYKDFGSMATVGRNKAVADLNKLKLHGFIAWMAWMLVHLRSILGIKNKIIILIEWIWSYFTYDQSIRLILFVPNKERNKKDQVV